VELLEEGHAIFWSQALQLCTPMTCLHEVAPVLEGKLKFLASVLERDSLRNASRNLSNSPQKVMSMEQEARYFYHINNEWLETVAEVRGLPGFHDFLRPNRLSTLQGAAIDALVIILNASKSTCDALIMTSSGHVQHISLPNLNFTVINTLATLIQSVTASNNLLQGSVLPLISNLFQQLPPISDAELSLRQLVEGQHGKPVSDTRIDPEDILCHVLGVLWTSAIQPVIESLNLEVCLSI
jgi:hypothetical protein